MSVDIEVSSAVRALLAPNFRGWRTKCTILPAQTCLRVARHNWLPTGAFTVTPGALRSPFRVSTNSKLDKSLRSSARAHGEVYRARDTRLDRTVAIKVRR